MGDKILANYNPYDLVNLIMDGVPTFGRPYEFDSEVSNQKNMTNAFGKHVKPTKVSTTCPKCGQGMCINIYVEDPPFTAPHVSCQICNPPRTDTFDPFLNPVSAKIISELELDPLGFDTKKVVNDGMTVAERMAARGAAVAKEPQANENDMLVTPAVIRTIVQEAPTGLGEEETVDDSMVDFDDNDLLE